MPSHLNPSSSASSSCSGSEVQHPLTLDRIAYQAVRLLGGAAAAILLCSRSTQLQLSGAWGFDTEHSHRSEGQGNHRRFWDAPARLALGHNCQITIADVQTEPDLITSHETATPSAYRSLAVRALNIDGANVGMLSLYRKQAGPWSPRDLVLLSTLADRTARAARACELRERRAQQLAALDGVLEELREQAHEHANRIHAISALVELGEQTEARNFISELMTLHPEPAARTVPGIEHATLAGLLLAEIAASRRRGIDLSVGPTCWLPRLPQTLSEFDTLTLVSNLLAYAFDGASTVLHHRRHVRFTARYDETGRNVVFETLDRDDHPVSPLTAGRVDTRNLQPLSAVLLREAVRAANGTLTVEQQGSGTRTTVSVPA